MTTNKITQMLHEFVKTGFEIDINGAIHCEITILGEVFDLQISRKKEVNYYDDDEEPTREEFEDAMASWPY